MKYWVLILMLLCPLSVDAGQCEQPFTEEQQKLLHKAYEIGEDDSLGYTLAAIVWKESFVGEYVVRINTASAQTGSWGVAHIQLTTAMWLTGETNLWRAKAVLAPRLIVNDALAMSLGLEVLLNAKKQVDNWREVVASYNSGVGRRHIDAAKDYAEDVAGKVKYLQTCMEI